MTVRFFFEISRNTTSHRSSVGNFHALLLFRTDEELAIARELVHRMVERAIALDGTCKLISSQPCRPSHNTNTALIGTGEHGVGIGKREYLYEELGENTVELMKTVKRAIDPLNLFNPGKVSYGHGLLVFFRVLIRIIRAVISGCSRNEPAPCA